MAGGKFGGGTGGVNDPYLVEDADDLHAVRFNPTANYKLIQCIDLDITPYNQTKGWQPIKNFSGVFNGNGKKIYNLIINRPTQDYVGLFEKIISTDTMQGRVYDLGIENANVIGDAYVGVLAGQFVQQTSTGYSSYIVERCEIMGQVQANNFGGGIAGGLAATVSGGAYNFCQDCFVDVDILPTANGKFGGVVGELNNTNRLANFAWTLNVGAFPSTINGVPQTGMVAYSFGYLSAGSYGTMTACYFDSTKWGVGQTTSGSTGVTTANLIKARLQDFDLRSNNTNTLIWSFNEGHRYQMLRQFMSNCYFIRIDSNYYVYDGTNWVIKFTSMPNRAKAMAQGMTTLDTIPYSAWDALRALSTAVEIIDFLELTAGTTEKTAAVALTLDAVNTNETKKFFNHTFSFADYDNGLVQIKKGVVN